MTEISKTVGDYQGHDAGAAFVLQTPEEFRDDFVREVSSASGQVALHAMQFEISQRTEPLFNALESAHNKGLDSVRFRYDRFAREHIRAGEGQAWSRAGITVHKGDKLATKVAIKEREQLIQSFEVAGISDPDFKKRGKTKRRSHDHIKLAIADGVAWFGTMNFRDIDFEISNFMMKVQDSQAVEAIKRIFGQIEDSSLVKDEVIPLDTNSNTKSEILVDAGNKGESVIYERALQMIDSLVPGDEFTLVSQWPPNSATSGLSLTSRFKRKAKTGVEGKFLMSPAEDLHFVKLAGRWLKWRADKKYGSLPGIQVKSLSRQTHVKALLIKRADGRSEVLFGSHNLTSWTVRNGTRELSMWSDDPLVVGQIESFITGLENE